MITFRDLGSISLAVLARAFNHAFSDYIVDMELPQVEFEKRFRSLDIDRTFSVGAFSGNDLVGLIMHGKRQYNGATVFFNGGTGVAPAFRGAALTQRMYEHVLPLLRAAGGQRVELEVIQGNLAAATSYRKTGFRKTRELPCFRGTVTIAKTHFELAEFPRAEWSDLHALQDWRPTWQYQTPTLHQLPDVGALAIRENGELVASVVYEYSGKVLQFGVKPAWRRQGMGHFLFAEVAQRTGAEVSVGNVDGNARSTLQFLNKIGLQEYLRQDEMVLSLT